MAAFSVGLLAAPAFSATPPSVFWANFDDGTIARASLDGSGGATLDTSGASSNADGVAVDAATGRIYWASRQTNQIFYANLDGSGGVGQLVTTGATVAGPSGVAIDPVTRRIYWANDADGISWAKLDGSGGGDLDTTGATVSTPQGIAVDHAANRVYWSNNNGGAAVGYANLDGTGSGGDLNTGSATVASPNGIAVDPAAGKVFWADFGAGISYANTDGSGGGDLDTSGATVSGSGGVAVGDGKVYWTNYFASNAPISYANEDNTGGGGDLDVTGANVSGPYNSPALYFGTPPTASTNAASAITSRGATLNATVNPNGTATTYHFEYGTSTAYGSRVPASDDVAGSDSSDHAVAQTLSALDPGTTYHFRVVATSAAGTTNGADQSFTTTPSPPVVTTGAASAVTTGGATLNGAVNPSGSATTYHFDYGTTTAYGSQAPAPDAAAGSDSSDHSVSQALTGLSAGTTYHFRLVATNAGGTTVGTDQIFTTDTPAAAGAPAASAPLAATGSASRNGSTVRGSVNPEGADTTYHFEYGPSSQAAAVYGRSTAPQVVKAGSGRQQVVAHVRNLQPGAVYHYRLVAVNSAGVMTGGDRTFLIRPRVAIAGMSSRRCAAAAGTVVRVRIATMATPSVRVMLDRHLLRAAQTRVMSIRLRTRSLRAGTHRLTASVSSAAGRVHRTVLIRVCSAPSFTG